MHGDEVIAFAGVASKSYALDIEVADPSALRDGSMRREEIKCKGIARGVRKKIKYDVWKTAVLNRLEHRVTQYTITSKSHKISTMGVEKRAVSPLDDKRYINLCGVHTVPHGSKFIPIMERLQRCIFCKPQ